MRSAKNKVVYLLVPLTLTSQRWYPLYFISRFTLYLFFAVFGAGFLALDETPHRSKPVKTNLFAQGFADPPYPCLFSLQCNPTHSLTDDVLFHNCLFQIASASTVMAILPNDHRSYSQAKAALPGYIRFLGRPPDNIIQTEISLSIFPSNSSNYTPATNLLKIQCALHLQRALVFPARLSTIKFSDACEYFVPIVNIICLHIIFTQPDSQSALALRQTSSTLLLYREPVYFSYDGPPLLTYITYKWVVSSYPPPPRSSKPLLDPLVPSSLRPTTPTNPRYHVVRPGNTLVSVVLYAHYTLLKSQLYTQQLSIKTLASNQNSTCIFVVLQLIVSDTGYKVHLLISTYIIFKPNSFAIFPTSIMSNPFNMPDPIDTLMADATDPEKRVRSEKSATIDENSTTASLVTPPSKRVDDKSTPPRDTTTNDPKVYSPPPLQNPVSEKGDDAVFAATSTDVKSNHPISILRTSRLSSSSGTHNTEDKSGNTIVIDEDNKDVDNSDNTEITDKNKVEFPFVFDENYQSEDPVALASKSIPSPAIWKAEREGPYPITELGMKQKLHNKAFVLMKPFTRVRRSKKVLCNVDQLSIHDRVSKTIPDVLKHTHPSIKLDDITVTIVDEIIVYILDPSSSFTFTPTTTKAAAVFIACARTIPSALAPLYNKKDKSLISSPETIVWLGSNRALGSYWRPQDRNYENSPKPESKVTFDKAVTINFVDSKRGYFLHQNVVRPKNKKMNEAITTKMPRKYYTYLTLTFPIPDCDSSDYGGRTSEAVSNFNTTMHIIWTTDSRVVLFPYPNKGNPHRTLILTTETTFRSKNKIEKYCDGFSTKISSPTQHRIFVGHSLDKTALVSPQVQEYLYKLDIQLEVSTIQAAEPVPIGFLVGTTKCTDPVYFNECLQRIPLFVDEDCMIAIKIDAVPPPNGEPRKKFVTK